MNRMRETPTAPAARLLMGPMDPVLWALAVSLLGFGVVMVYSASSIEATLGFSDPYYFLKRLEEMQAINLERFQGAQSTEVIAYSPNRVVDLPTVQRYLTDPNP